MKKTVLSCAKVGLIFAATFFIFHYVIIPVKVDGASMENTLHDESYALINAIMVKPENIKRFDIVVAESKELDEKIIKRVIGLPGETIQYKDDVLYVNGEAIQEDFLDPQFVEQAKKKDNATLFTVDFQYTVPEGEYFLMGDNRLRSTDSRVLGPFPLEDIVGMNGIVVYPFDSIQWLY